MTRYNNFDDTKAYVQQEDVYFNDGREVDLLRHVLSRPDLNSLRGSPQSILAAIDDFARNEKYLMNVGETKGAIITELIASTCPGVMIELGAYIGYSAILFGDAVRAAGGREYLCLESSSEFATIARELIDLAGLSSFVKVIVGPSCQSIRELQFSEGVTQIDILFLDHYKPAYLPDLKLCEQLQLIRSGSIIAADNVIKPGNPPYLAYVRSELDVKKRALKAQTEGKPGHNDTVIGNPNLIYESQLFRSFEPTGLPDGIEITRCVGEDTVNLNLDKA